MFHYWSDVSEKSHVFSFQLAWLFSEAVNGGGDFHEIHRAAKQIRAGNRDDWNAAFTDQGNRLREIADKALASGHRVTASASLFRAFTYYRSAEHALRGGDERKLPLYQRAIQCFKEALGRSLSLRGGR